MRIEAIALSSVTPLVDKLKQIARLLVEGGAHPDILARIQAAMGVLNTEDIIPMADLIGFVECCYDQAVDQSVYRDGLKLHHAIQLAFGRKVTPLFKFIVAFHGDQISTANRLTPLLEGPFGAPMRRAKARRRGRAKEEVRIHELTQFDPRALCRFLLGRIGPLEEGRALLERYQLSLVINDGIVFSRFLAGLRRLVALRQPLSNLLKKLEQ